ncbi:ATP-binding cassette sub-family C member 10 [Malaya genurostris]|uniref:ATP-binding cassette sub-family C member 10 n=1 Tax=Malaya genurostris TaxID=325434 RepID=UPI0026F3CA68|nr:ATP-binding cassette sub-family C member 10 [Malaya genurostris]XP_058453343.1 ATP-binding cassette sub-family C member 10 [Malaya genurostris]
MSYWQFSWTDVCPSGVRPWVKDYNELAPCFQEICLQLPILVLFAVLSSFYYGCRFRRVLRNATQMRALRLRIVASFGLGLVPVLKLFYMIRINGQIYPIDVLLACVQFVAWTVHIGFLSSWIGRGSLSHRGPLWMIVLWTSLLALSGIWVHTNFRSEYWIWYVSDFSLFVVYGGTLIASGNAHYVREQRTVDQEREALLSRTYTRFLDDIDESALGPIEDDANFLSRLVFQWVKPLIVKGVAGKLRKNDDLFDLPECLNMNQIVEKLQKQLSAAHSLFKALHKCFGWEFYSIGLLRLLADLSGFAGPVLLGGLLRSENFINGTLPSDDCRQNCNITDMRAYYYAFGLMWATLISCFAGVHFNWRMTLVSTKMRMSLVTAIYRKSLTAKGLRNARPDILNLMSTDTDRIVNSCISFHSMWSIPFQLFTTLYLLYTQLGLAFLAGVAFAILLIPINRQIALKIGQLSQGLMTAKDGRISVTTETITGAKHIKLNAWEDVFIGKIEQIRREEVGFLSRRKYLDALCVYFWATTPVLMCLLTFGTSVLLGSTLTAATTYTSVALLNMLIGPLNAFPWVLNGLTEAWVSLKRVQELIDLPNIDLTEYYKPLHQMDIAFSGSSPRPVVIAIKDGYFEFETQRSRKELNLVQEDIIDFRFLNLNLQIRRGELICLEGPVGGGKTSLLEVILANFKCTQGIVALENVDEGFGYVAQSAWLQRGTIRENILWGEMYDDVRYKAVIHACALNYDLNVLKGDSMGVGEQGRTLSGGQRARIAFARAIYQNKDVYLLDDILSALDAHVASHIVRHCIFGLLKSKTRIIVTQHPTVLTRANQILHIEKGVVSQSDISSSASMMSECDEEGDDSSHTLDIDYEPQSPNKADDSRSVDSVMAEETREFGHLDRKVLSAYWRAMGRSLGFWVIFLVLLMQVSRNLTDAWLAYWVGTSSTGITPPGNGTEMLQQNQDQEDTLWSSDYFRSLVAMAQDFLGSLTKGVNHQSELSAELQQEALLETVDNKTLTLYYLGIYSGLAVGNSLITFGRAFLFAYAGIKAAKCIHDKLLKSVIYTKFEFFDVVPLGRILNRFSSDVYTIDDSLPFITNILLAQFFGLLGALAISLYAMPWLGLLVIPLCPIYLTLQNQYRYASRDIKRLSSNALSPLYAHFTETLQGMTTIRAMRGEARFKRDFIFKLGESIKVQLSASAAQQWLGLRLQLLGAVLVGGAGLLAAITSAHLTSPEMVGLAISYALSITGLLSGLLNAVSETEQEFVAVERINQYCELEREVNADGTADPPFGWPYQGVVMFDKVFLRYREHLPHVLNGISMHISSCERIGLVGRTGAGKTSILASMLRVVPLAQGTVTIDNMNIATLPLDVVRSRIAIVSQDPFLFKGSIRENLDPRNLHLDSEIWEAITRCLASPLVQALGGLDAKLDPSGSNLSAGQKQLLCLTRALLKKSKIVLIDEGTANLDYESESAIQLVLKNAFRGRTVILIAHRLNGLQNTDRIVVMSDGEIAEQGAPRELAQNSETLFYSMLQEQHNTDFAKR